MSRVLIFRHVPFEGAGLLEDVLRGRGIGVEYADLYLNPAPPPPDPAGYQGLVFMGGPMSVNDELPYLRLEQGFIRDAADAGMPVLGICLGAQLIAAALGGRVRRNPAKEIGWFDIRCTEEAAGDPLFAGIGTETVFHWHGETFDLPPGAVLLASSELCANQAFRAGERVWGLQFHLEVTPEMIADWCLQDENCGDVRELSAPLDPRRNAERLRVLSHRIFGEWCGLLQPLECSRVHTGEHGRLKAFDGSGPER
jgi:GMP synthase-like glutamine amidotransferase